MSIGTNIRQGRRYRKLTQRELAEKTGIAEITIRGYEKDKFKPSFKNLIKIADALNVDFYNLVDLKDLDIYSGEIDQVPPVIESLTWLSTEKTELFNLVDALDEVSQKKALDYIDYLIYRQKHPLDPEDKNI